MSIVNVRDGERGHLKFDEFRNFDDCNGTSCPVRLPGKISFHISWHRYLAILTASRYSRYSFLLFLTYLRPFEAGRLLLFLIKPVPDSQATQRSLFLRIIELFVFFAGAAGYRYAVRLFLLSNRLK